MISFNSLAFFVFLFISGSAGEGHVEIVKILCEMGANVNCEDRWNRRPLDDAKTGMHEECQRVLKEYGAEYSSAPSILLELDESSKRSVDNMRVNFDELELIDRIGAGAFGEIYKCRYVRMGQKDEAACVCQKFAKRCSWINRPSAGVALWWQPRLSEQPRFAKIGPRNEQWKQLRMGQTWMLRFRNWTTSKTPTCPRATSTWPWKTFVVKFPS